MKVASSVASGFGLIFRNPEIQTDITVEQNIDSALTTSEDLTPLSGGDAFSDDIGG